MNRKFTFPQTPAFKFPVEDINRAIGEVYEGQYNIEHFSIICKKSITIEEAVMYANDAYIPFVQAKTFVGLSHRLIVTALRKKGKPAYWCKRALSWLNGSFPAIIFVSISHQNENTKYLLGDGHHRLALANALGMKKISAIFLNLIK